MNKNNISLLRKEVETIKSTLYNRKEDEIQEEIQRFMALPPIERLRWSAESWYETPIAENIAMDVMKMSFEEYIDMVKSKTEEELVLYLEASDAEFRKTLVMSNQDGLAYVNKVSESIKAELGKRIINH